MSGVPGYEGCQWSRGTMGVRGPGVRGVSVVPGYEGCQWSRGTRGVSDPGVRGVSVVPGYEGCQGLDRCVWVRMDIWGTTGVRGTKRYPGCVGYSTTKKKKKKKNLKTIPDPLGEYAVLVAESVPDGRQA